MSTDQYPEVSSDESGLAPPSMRGPEWPKKIRTLTAAELDRLTIDGAGRFYWDGRLVSYSPPQPLGSPPPESELTTEGTPTDPLDQSLELLDRAALELKPADAQDFSDTPRTTDDHAKPEDATTQAVDYDALVAAAAAAPAVAATAAMVPARSPSAGEIAPSFGAAQVHEPIQMSPMVYGLPDKMRMSLSGWQSTAMILAVLSLLVAATGIALSGLVAAHDWGCRAGIVRSYCPAMAPRPQTQPRVDIPA